MDPCYLVNQPNRVAEVYRNYCPIALPVDVENHLDFIDITEDGYTIVGSSNLSGRYQKGSIWCFKNPSHAPDKQLCVTGLECDSSVCDGKCIGNNKKIIVGQDSGALTIFELNEENEQPSKFEYKSSRHDHNSCVLTIAVSPSLNLVLSSGMDLCIKVWDVQEFVPIRTFNHAHGHHVTSVGFLGEEEEAVFASCSLDGNALLWDTRQPTPASVLLEGSEGLTALTWQDGDTLAVGSNFGNVYLVDTRTRKTVNQSTPFNRPLYRLLAVDRKLLAACADSHEVKVIDALSDKLDVRYTDSRHRDFVRGLAYHTESSTLYSCGWDKQVIAHTFTS